MTDAPNAFIPLSVRRTTVERQREPHVLLIGPYDPKGGEYTFLAPPLGVWRLAGVLQRHGVPTHVFDPNCCLASPEASLVSLMHEQRWDVVGISTTGMTLPYDLALAHLVRRLQREARLIAGGMEATFKPEAVLTLGPFDLAVLGEGEEPLLAIVDRVRAGSGLEGIPGTAWREPGGTIQRAHGAALTREGLRNAIFETPYEQMPYRQYWERLEASYQIGDLPVKADREARLAEIRSVRLVTLNYCPMGCTFCSSTNFLNAAQGSTVKISRLNVAECLTMIQRIVHAQPGVRTIIFQDDIFVFTNDDRVVPLCEGIVAAKTRGEIPPDLQFISTNRIDAMTPARLAAMRRAGFRVLGFGVESFSVEILREFNKAQIHPFIGPVLKEALRIGITPFLDMILTSPRCTLADLAENIRQAFTWVLAGCEVGMYPYVIPFSGSAMARDASQFATTVFEQRQVEGTSVTWNQPTKILPLDPVARGTILRIESRFERQLLKLQHAVPHLPSRVRSHLWILSAIQEIDGRRYSLPSQQEVKQALRTVAPGLNRPPAMGTRAGRTHPARATGHRKAHPLAVASPGQP
jgi:radical SAM superfamily enzyme YgiQ (UPF0313 family)